MRRFIINMGAMPQVLLCAMLALGVGIGRAASTTTVENNPVRAATLTLGPAAGRLVIGFRTTQANALVQSVASRRTGQSVEVVQAQTDPADLSKLASRVGLNISRSRQVTPSLHVVHLTKTLYGSDVDLLLARLRADPAVNFADIDYRRHAHAIPDDPLFVPTTAASGQWYMLTPSLISGGDAAATDAVSAWNLTTGSSATVIADVDTGIRFDHPDLLRAGFGGRVLPGYDFVGQDLSVTSGAALGTFLIANDGDGWDPDPSDPGDWLTATDEQNALFPNSSCGDPADSSWHGTRVMGILGALTNNATGIAGMTWKPYLLPVRALGKCGGYDSDIIAGMQWAAGLAVTGVANNPYPANIINLSLGGSGACPSSYADAVNTLVGMGVLIVASAGNENGPVDAPGNCAGVLAVAGLRNVGTKVGYSSFGVEVSVAAPAGNCINQSGACLKSIDTTSNAGLTTPTTAIYTNETNPNLGTSFSAPIVSGVAALMRAVNGNLTPAQLISRIKSSAAAFPQPAGLPVCGTKAASDAAAAKPPQTECACPNDGKQCGAGMVNAFQAVNAALRPIAAVSIPQTIVAGSNLSFDASGSAAACDRTIVSYAWAATGSVTLQSDASAPRVFVTSSGAGGTLTVTVTDSANATDTASVAISATGATSTAPATAGTASSACLAEQTITPAPPTITVAFAPSSVGENVTSTLTITLKNPNGFALTQAALAETLPSNLTIASATSTSMGVVPVTTCPPSTSTLTSTSTGVVLSGAIIPANASCSITLPVQSATPGTYTNALAAGALVTAQAGQNSAAASADLSVTAPSKGGGGEIDGWDTLFVIGVILAGRRKMGRRRP